MNFLDNICEKESHLPQVIKHISNQSLPLLFYGAGLTAKYYYEILFKNKISISEVVVDKTYYQPNLMFEGLPVKSFQESLNENSRANVFLAFSVIDINSVIKNLLKTEKINEVFYLDDPAIFNGKIKLYDYRLIIDNLTEFNSLYSRLEDELSRNVLCGFINQRISHKRGYLDNFWSQDDYNPKGIFKYSHDEVYVDCGAYDGDTVTNFIEILKSAGGNYQSIIAIEPDKKNYSKLKKLLSRIKKLTCINKGVWDKETKMKFFGTGTASSFFSSEGEDVIEVGTIDNILNGEKVTYIKMDVEGAEQKALMGARETIIKYRPKLGICVYHKTDDLITIPKYINSLVPDYKFYLRIHRPFSQELVFYATI